MTDGSQVPDDGPSLEWNAPQLGADKIGHPYRGGDGETDAGPHEGEHRRELRDDRDVVEGNSLG